MKKSTSKKSSEKNQSEGLSTTGVISIIVALIALVGTLTAAVLNYSASRYQVDKPIQQTEVAQTIPQLEARARIMSNSWNAALVLPNNVSPEQNSYSTLIEYPDFNDWLIAPKTLSDDSNINIKAGKLLQAEITLGNNSASNGSWIKIDNKINVTLDLVSSNIDDHVNLAWVKSGGGGGDYKYFSLIKLGQQTNLLNQTISSKDYDFFSLQPGESDVFMLEFVCEAPGIYQASARLSLVSSSGSEEEKVTGFEKVLCPNSYSLWITYLDIYSQKPLEYLGDYYWNGNEYQKTP